MLFLKIQQHSQEKTCVKSLFATLLKKGTPTQVFSYEYYETLKNSFFNSTPLLAASAHIK